MAIGQWGRENFLFFFFIFYFLYFDTKPKSVPGYSSDTFTHSFAWGLGPREEEGYVVYRRMPAVVVKETSQLLLPDDVLEDGSLLDLPGVFWARSKQKVWGGTLPRTSKIPKNILIPRCRAKPFRSPFYPVVPEWISIFVKYLKNAVISSWSLCGRQDD